MDDERQISFFYVNILCAIMSHVSQEKYHKEN
jgi:hypothetical protein